MRAVDDETVVVRLCRLLLTTAPAAAAAERGAEDEGCRNGGNHLFESHEMTSFDKTAKPITSSGTCPKKTH